MVTIFSQVLLLIIFVAVGFSLSKVGVVKNEHSQILSSLLTYVFLPCNIFKNFSKNFTVQYLTDRYLLVIISTALIVILITAAYFAAKLFSKDNYERCIYEYSLIIPNYGYMGYALAQALLGEVGVINIMTFALPVSLYIYTVGFAKLTKRGLSLKKLCNPIIIATALGIIVGLSGIGVGDLLTNVLETASKCMAPVSMLLAGIVISGFSLKRILGDKKAYVLSFIRLIAVPITLGLVLRLFFEPYLVQTVVLFYALPCGLNTVVFPRLVNENCEIGASQALISTLLSCFTLPLILSIFHMR